LCNAAEQPAHRRTHEAGLARGFFRLVCDNQLLRQLRVSLVAIFHPPRVGGFKGGQRVGMDDSGAKLLHRQIALTALCI